LATHCIGRHCVEKKSEVHRYELHELKPRHGQQQMKNGLMKKQAIVVAGSARFFLIESVSFKCARLSNLHWQG
jgi:hypothetical protein